MLRLLLATRNAHKKREFAQLLGPDFELQDLIALPHAPVVDETGSTFAENAMLKAAAVSRYYPGLVLGDDSGLEVDALNGAPGIRSARYAHENAPDAQNVSKLLTQLRIAKVRPNQRTARFVCEIALARGAAVLGTFRGIVEGTITPAPRGGGGFGYDSVFVPSTHAQTFAELSAEEKNAISHRARAVALLKKALLADL